MLTLYLKNGCDYCAKVQSKLKDLGLEWTEKNVATPGVYEELEKRGGERQEPYLVDESTGFEMYESDFICKYLERTYGGKKQG